MTSVDTMNEPPFDLDTLRRWLPSAVVFLIVGVLAALPSLLRDHDRTGHWSRYIGLGTGCLMAASVSMLVANEVPWMQGRIGLLIAAGWLGGYAGLPFVDRIVRRIEIALDRILSRLGEPPGGQP